jgi:hypothetical protein
MSLRSIAIIGLVVITSFALACSIAAYVVSSRPIRVIPAAPDALTNPIPIVPAGLLCTYPPEDFVALNATCFPALFNATATFDYCRARRNTTDSGCVIAACTALLALASAPPAVPSRTFYLFNGLVEVSSTGLYDNGTVRIAHVIQQIMVDNYPDAVAPLLMPAPRPLLPEKVRFGSPDVGNKDMRVLAREFIRQYFAFSFNYRAQTKNDFAPPALQPAIANASAHSVWTPSRCPDASIRAIPWLYYDNVTVVRMHNIALIMLIYNASNPAYAPAGWVATCRALTAVPVFCNSFPNYYSFASLTNYSVLPSPYRDITTMLTAYNEEYAGCAVSRGCLGYSGTLVY